MVVVKNCGSDVISDVLHGGAHFRTSEEEESSCNLLFYLRWNLTILKREMLFMVVNSLNDRIICSMFIVNCILSFLQHSDI